MLHEINQELEHHVENHRKIQKQQQHPKKPSYKQYLEHKQNSKQMKQSIDTFNKHLEEHFNASKKPNNKWKKFIEKHQESHKMIEQEISSFETPFEKIPKPK